MKITKELLVQKQACIDGAKIFNRFYPNGFDLGRWTPEYQFKVITKTRLRKYVGWAYNAGLIPLWSLSSANLSLANLRSANLSLANLSLANLSSANLSLANLRSANLRSANLRLANLSLANLSSADLSSANLSLANLSLADLSSANLRWADLSSACYSKYTGFPEGFDPKAAGMLWIET